MSDTPEGKVKAMIKRRLAQHFIYAANHDRHHEPLTHVEGWYYMPSQNGMGVTGIPDFVGLYNTWGHGGSCTPWMIEAKGPNGELTENQKLRKHEVEQLGCLYRVVSNEEEMDDFLRDLLGPA